MTLRRCLLLAALTVLPAQAQDASLHLDFGLVSSLDHAWKVERDTTGGAGLVTKFPLALEGALVFPVKTGAIRGALRYAVDEPFSNLQLGADWIHTFSRKGAESTYGSAGLSLNYLSGRIEVVAPGYTNGNSPQPIAGVYEKRNQSTRPGLRFGFGYAFSRSFAIEGAANIVSLGSAGANGYQHSSSLYLTLTGSYRIPKIFAGN